ncbi:polysaccharide biosynthesis protein [Phycicoccus flavus]|uniref:polysaccharide biosynthesis protein n=1 Tax=Phycicoccus flavus TaxID=2502783 RepID=UPI001F34ED7A|nr:nucleoside-diphosphate sugar epimerase/dehydratase [Phycicoccus flavus]
MLSRIRWSLLDALIWVLALALATVLRLDFVLPDHVLQSLATAAAVAGGLQLVGGWVFGPYGINHELGSFEETGELARTTLGVGVVLGAVGLFTQLVPLPRSVPVTATLVALISMFAVRFVLRSRKTRRQRLEGDVRRALVVGAGSGGRVLVESLARDPASGLHAVALVDDDPSKQRLRIAGTRVRGRVADIAQLAKRYEANTVIIAIPSADAETVRSINSIATEANLSVLVLPPVRQLFGQAPTASDLHDLDVADLLGRKPVDLDMAAISEYLSGRRVLVTGAGGSIGAELCRQISRFFPAELFMLDRDESGLHGTQMSIEGHALLDSESLVLCDIRDADGLHEAFRRTRPEIVFHAAALKHLTLLERHPAEAMKTNVIGTQNVIDAARAVGVTTFVNISTDKAANPSCVLGYSKRVAERLTAAADALEPTSRYVSVRFGNVLGSRGSVVVGFTEQIRKGGPVTVTHPDVERYFMLIPEACQLVLQAGSIGGGGEVMVLDMGQPVKIVDVARTMIQLSGRPEIEIVYTGLRPGEKLTEELFMTSDEISRSTHPLISQVFVPGLPEDERDGMPGLDEPGPALGWMVRAAQEGRARHPA